MKIAKLFFNLIKIQISICANQAALFFMLVVTMTMCAWLKRISHPVDEELFFRSTEPKRSKPQTQDLSQFIERAPNWFRKKSFFSRLLNPKLGVRIPIFGIWYSLTHCSGRTVIVRYMHHCISKKTRQVWTTMWLNVIPSCALCISSHIHSKDATGEENVQIFAQTFNETFL